MSTTIDSFAAVNASSAGGAPKTQNETAAADRFLKLLVTQMQNQDPLNPMDNAQITSQMAQINTVSGLEKLNTTVEGLNAQFVQMQALQGAALVGHDVTLAGDGLAIEGGTGVGGFELAGPADTVKVEVIDTSGRVVDTLQLGAAAAGAQSFDWKAGKVVDGSAYRFRVEAKAGSQVISSTALMRDHVEAVSMGADGLRLELSRSGSVAYTAVKAFN